MRRLRLGLQQAYETVIFTSIDYAVVGGWVWAGGETEEGSKAGEDAVWRVGVWGDEEE